MKHVSTSIGVYKHSFMKGAVDHVRVVATHQLQMLLDYIYKSNSSMYINTELSVKQPFLQYDVILTYKFTVKHFEIKLMIVLINRCHNYWA